MNQKQIDEMNKEITYEDGKIFWEGCKGYTSNTIKYLFQCGYRAGVIGCVHSLYDMDGNKVTSAYSWPGLLLNTAKIMA
jgi:hypothetical protein